MNDVRARLAEMSVDELRARLSLGRWLLAQIDGDPDPRSPGAVEHYRGQVDQLQAELDRRLAGGGQKPPEGGEETKPRPKDIVIAMDALTLTSKLGKTGG